MTKIIAEIGWNHMGDMNLAKKMIAAAAASGADIVKFQTWKVKNLKSGPWDNDGRRQIYEKAELTERVQENKQEVINKENIVNNKQPWQNLKNEVESNIETQALKKDEELIDGKLEESPENSETDIDNNDENWNSETEDLNRDKTYDDINVQGINFFDSIGICFKKYFL